MQHHVTNIREKMKLSSLIAKLLFFGGGAFLIFSDMSIFNNAGMDRLIGGILIVVGLVQYFLERLTDAPKSDKGAEDYTLPESVPSGGRTIGKKIETKEDAQRFVRMAKLILLGLPLGCIVAAIYMFDPDAPLAVTILGPGVLSVSGILALTIIRPVMVSFLEVKMAKFEEKELSAKDSNAATETKAVSVDHDKRARG